MQKKIKFLKKKLFEIKIFSEKFYFEEKFCNFFLLWLAKVLAHKHPRLKLVDKVWLPWTDHPTLPRWSQLTNYGQCVKSLKCIIYTWSYLIRGTYYCLHFKKIKVPAQSIEWSYKKVRCYQYLGTILKSNGSIGTIKVPITAYFWQ